MKKGIGRRKNLQNVEIIPKHNTNAVWKNVKGILNWKSSWSPNQLFYKGLLLTKPQAVAQNEYFLDKITTIRENLPPPTSDPLQKLKYLMKEHSCSFSLSAVHPDVVEKIISALSNSSPFGLDNINTFAIKLIKKEIVPALTHIINLSISSREFPLYWKRSKIIPLHKNENLLNPKNYRPVAIVPIFSKILERVIFNQLVKYLADTSLSIPTTMPTEFLTTLPQSSYRCLMTGLRLWKLESLLVCVFLT